MKKGLIYARVSTEEQAKEGQSIDAQLKLCRRYADENDISIIESYKDEGKSGSNTNRPALQALLERVTTDPGIECVLILDTDRLARNTLDHLSIKAILKKHNVQLISISQPMIDDSPEGRFIDVVLAGANALQSQITGRKTSKVMEEKAKAGWWPGWAPTGYQNIDNPNPVSQFDKRIISPHPTDGTLVTKIFDLYATGTFSLASLREKMYSLGLKSPRTHNLQESAVNNILNNPLYYGVIPWKGKEYPGKHTPLTTKEKWLACQEILDNHNQHASRTRKHDYLLRGFLFCDDCGSRYWAAPHKGHTTIVEYYFCKNCKKGTYIETESLEKEVEKWVGSIQITDKYATKLVETAKQVILESRSSRNSELQTLMNQKIAIQNKLTKAEDNLLDGTLSKEQFRRISERIENELNSIESTISNTQHNYQKVFDNIQELVNMARNLKKTYHEADKDLKRFYLDLFFDRFIVSEKHIKAAVPSKELKPFLKDGQIKVRVTMNWLPR